MRSAIGFVSEWQTFETRDNLLDELRLGDLLEIKRDVYCHWVVSITLGPNPLIVHRTGDVNGGTLTSSATKASASCHKKGSSEVGVVDADQLWSILRDSRVRINNSVDKIRSPKTAEQIVVTALQSIHKDVNGKYNLISNNCEHFAHFCRYGKPVSWQVVNGILKFVSYTAIAVVVGVGLLVNKAIR